MVIDTGFDFRSDSRPGRDPDAVSPTLHRYHQLLWGRPLPSGARFDLTDGRPVEYLVHHSELGDFYLSSDAVIPTFSHKARAIVEQLPESEVEAFEAISYTIGGMMLFPSNRVNGKMTINGARGLHPRIADRFDLTLECIRRHYRGEESPLGETLDRYSDFFALFGDFAGYVEHFLLQDLVNEGGSTLNFFMPFDDFKAPAVPQDLATYLDYRCRCTDFIEARNRRVADLAPSLT